MANMQDLEHAFMKAYNSGDTKNARILAQELQRLSQQPQAPQAPQDSSLGTAFKFGDLSARANSINFAADANQAMNDGVVGNLMRTGREYVGNPLRYAFGLDPVNQDQIDAQFQAQARSQAAELQQQADALNYKSLTTEDVSGPVSAVQFGAQKIAESAPYMMTAMAAPMVTPLLTSGEVNAGLKDIEGLSLDDRVALASTGGVLMAVLENLGAGLVLKGMPKEMVGKLGVQGVSDLLKKKGLGRIATAFAAGATAEGITETGQEAIKIGTEAVAGKDFQEGEIGTRLKEAGAAGFAAGGGIRATGQTAVETVDAASNVDGLSKIHKGDTDALSDVARDLQQLASEYPDRDIQGRDVVGSSSINDATETLNDLHTQYMKQFDAAKLRAQQAGIDTNTAEFRTAERRAKNKAKNEASAKDIEILTGIDPELGALARKLNIITNFNKSGVKGGLGQLADNLNPLAALNTKGTFGRGAGSMQTATASGLAYISGGGTLGAVAGARMIDVATGSRNRVRKAINRYSARPGIDTAQQGQTQINESEIARQTEQLQRMQQAQQQAGQQSQMNNLKAGVEIGGGPVGAVTANTGLNQRQVAMAVRALKRTRPDLQKTIENYQAALEGKADRIGQNSKEFYALQDAIRDMAKKLGLESNYAASNQNQMLPPGVAPTNAKGSQIFNPIAYQATVDTAQRSAQVAIDSAPTPALAQRANVIANARTPAAKQALIDQTLAENPDHKDYIDNVLGPLAGFGPKQQSRFPGADIIAEEQEAAQDMYGERVIVLNHGTNKRSAQAIEDEGFGTPSVFATVNPQDADEYAQAVLDTNDNGRVTMMFPESVFDQLRRNKLVQTREYKAPFGRTIIEYELNRSALDRADVFRSRSLHKAGNPITDAERAQLVADALGNGFNVKFNASDDAYYRRQQLITLTADSDKRKTLHEIFHAVENKLTPEEMQVLRNTPEFKDVMNEVQELYPELGEAGQMLEGLAETAARIQARRDAPARLKYILAKIKELIEAFKNLIDGNGFNSVNSILDEVYTGKAYQRQINEHYAQLYVPDIAYAKKDKPGGPMVAKRFAALKKIEEQAKIARQTRGKIEDEYNTAMDNIAANLGIEGVDGAVIRKTLSRVTPSTDLGMVAADYLRAVGVMNDQGVLLIDHAQSDKDDGPTVDEAIQPYRDDFMVLLNALQKAKIIDDFGLAFRTSAGGKMYPVHMLEPLLPELVAKAELNNASKFENRAKPSHWEGKPEINRHPLGSYDQTEAFIEREQKQALVINDKIYEMMNKMMTTPQTHRGLDLIFKKDGTTDSAYTLAAAEAIKQYQDNQNDTGGMTPVFMKRRAQDRLRVDTLNGSASYQGKAGKAVWEFPNWEPLGETGFEQFAHALRDHFGISNELPFNERVGFLFGTVGQYMELAGRPASDVVPQSVLEMPLIDYLVSAYGQPGSYVYSHTRGGTPKLFLDKQSGQTLYQMNHAIFDVADHGFEIQRAAVELGRMRAYLENIVPNSKKTPSSELFMSDEAQQALMEFKSSYPVWFDGTSSSYQLHAVLTGDANLAQETNLGDFNPDGPGGDLYRPGAEYLQRALNLPQTKTRKITKKFISNRRSYGQVKLTAMKSGADEIAKSLPEYGDFSDTAIKDSLKQIQNDLEADFDSKFTGAAIAEGISRAIAKTLYNIQGQDNFSVMVPLPDGDVAVYSGKLPDSAKRRVTWEMDKDRRIAVPVYQDKKAITGFAAFLNHSLDAYVQRELARRLRASGATGFMHTHDAFAVHAKNGEMMRELYWQIMRDIANSDIYGDIARANGLDPQSINVKYSITTPQGPQTVEVPLSILLQQIQQQKLETFSKDAAPNFYALS